MGGEEPADDELTGPDGGDSVTDCFDDADVVVPDSRGGGDLLDASVAPQVGPTDTGGDGADDSVRGVDDGGVGPLLETDVAWAMDDRAQQLSGLLRVMTG